MFEVRNLTVRYGRITAVRDVSFEVEEGEIVTLIGANGAGKTTLLRTISGLIRPSAGEITFDGRSLAGLAAEKVNALGVAHVPEGRRLFPQMSVRENLEMGAYSRRDGAAIARDLDMVLGHFPVLRERSGQMAGSLSGGQQQMVAMGRALMSSPRLILMDEPTLGLSPILCQEIATIIREIHDMGRTVILVEQNARLALRLARRAYVMETGSIVMRGMAEEMQNDPEVQRSYLGVA